MLRNVCETRHSAAISGSSSRVTAMPASSSGRSVRHRMSVPGLANSVRNARQRCRRTSRCPRLTVSGRGRAARREPRAHARPRASQFAIDLTPTLASSLRASSGGTSFGPVGVERMDGGLGRRQFVVKPGLAKRGETGDVEQRHREKDEADGDDEHAPGQSKAPACGTALGAIVSFANASGGRGDLGPALRSNWQIQHCLTSPLEIVFEVSPNYG